MSGVWESLFREEKQDWTASIVVTLTNLTNLMMEIPCTIFALVSTTIVFIWESIMAQAQAVYEILRFEEWWGIEHSVFASVMSLVLVCLLRRGRGDWFSLLCQINCNLQTLATFGCFLWMAAGLQGGVIFGGKLFLPTLALFSVAFQMSRMIQYNADKETYGYGVGQVAHEGPGAKVQKYFGHFVCLETSFFFCLATFGMPKFNAEDLVPLLTIFPAVSMAQQLLEYFQPEAAAPAVAVVPVEADAAPVQTDITDNGNATKMMENEEPAAVKEIEDKPADAAVAAPVEEITEAEPTPDGEAGGTKVEEAKPEEPAAKPSAVCLIKIAASKLVCKAAGVTCDTVTKVKAVIVDVVEKIVSLPWNYIVSMTSSVGTAFGLTYAYWSLTEDYAVLIIPVVCYLLPMAAEKALAMNWINERGYLSAVELTGLGAAVTQYYLFRSYISMPF